MRRPDAFPEKGWFMVIDGFRMKTGSLEEIEGVISAAEGKVRGIAEKTYGRLLGKETAFLCDCIALGAVQRTEETIFEQAVASLGRQIEAAGASGLEGEKNFRVFAQFMPFEGAVYVKLLAGNPAYRKAFTPLEDVSVSEAEAKNEQNGKTALWIRLHQQYADRAVLTANLSYVPEPDRSKIVYPSVRERSQTMARDAVMNRLLRQACGGQDIPPYLLMRKVEEAAGLLLQDSTKAMLEEEERRLKKILLPLDKDDSVVFRSIKEAAAPEPEARPAEEK